MTRRRVVVTGIGLITPLGCTAEIFWQNLARGRSGVRLVEQRDDADGRSIIAGSVSGFSPDEYVDLKTQRLMSPSVAFGVAAAQLSAADAKLTPFAIDPERLGVFVGSRGSSSERKDLIPAVRRATIDGDFRLDVFGAEGLPLVHPMWLLKGLSNNVLYFVSLKHNAQGMNNNLPMGGVAATMAIGEAFRAIECGNLDVAFAGGYDSTLDAGRVEMFTLSGLVTAATDSAEAGRPFDRRRDGFVLSEGAGFFVLEAHEHAKSRGVRAYGEVLGYGAATAPATSSGLGPSARGVAAALSAALADASVGRPDAVLALGLATPSSDLEETRGLKRVFGADAATIPAPALKSMTGNTFAASGAIEAAAALMAMRNGLLPPTVNLTEPDPACDLDHVRGTEARPASLRIVAVNNANLAGAHSALVLGRSE